MKYSLISGLSSVVLVYSFTIFELLFKCILYAIKTVAYFSNRQYPNIVSESYLKNATTIILLSCARNRFLSSFEVLLLTTLILRIELIVLCFHWIGNSFETLHPTVFPFHFRLFFKNAMLLPLSSRLLAIVFVVAMCDLVVTQLLVQLHSLDMYFLVFELGIVQPLDSALL